MEYRLAKFHEEDAKKEINAYLEKDTLRERRDKALKMARNHAKFMENKKSTLPPLYEERHGHGINVLGGPGELWTQESLERIGVEW